MTSEWIPELRNQLQDEIRPAGDGPCRQREVYLLLGPGSTCPSVQVSTSSPKMSPTTRINQGYILGNPDVFLSLGSFWMNSSILIQDANIFSWIPWLVTSIDQGSLAFSWLKMKLVALSTNVTHNPVGVVLGSLVFLIFTSTCSF